MRDDDQHHADHGLEQAGGGRQRVFAGLEADAVDVGVDDIDRRAVDVVLQVDDLVEVGAEEHAPC